MLKIKNKEKPKNKLFIMILGVGMAALLILFLIALVNSYKHNGKVSFVTSQISGDNKISRKPSPCRDFQTKLDNLPTYEEGKELDLRGKDISNLDIRDRLNDLIYANFDTRTKWPNMLPENFNIEEIMEYGKNPGLNIRKLHEKGITGKGVAAAIIDQTLLTEHDEYSENLKFYEEIHAEKNAVMHGAAVASILAGKHVGVAPESDLYYIGQTFYKEILEEGQVCSSFSYTAEAINRILEVNKTLHKDKKIRVISISAGWNEKDFGFKEIDEAVKKAIEEGILVVSTSMDRYYNYNFHGLGRDDLSNPDKVSSYTPGLFWQKRYYEKYEEYKKSINTTILVPMDSRCIASPKENSDYVFYRNGGLSWSVPYVSGLYVLCCQVKPDITPEIFFKEALNTGDIIEIKNNDKTYKLGTIVNPQRLIEKIDRN